MERARDPLGDLALHGEDVLHVAVVDFGPDVLLGRGVDQLPGDADAIPRATHASLENRADAQLARDLADRLDGVLVAHDRSAGDDFHVLDLRELGEDVLRHPVGEIRVLGTGAQVLEGEDCDRFARDIGRKRPPLAEHPKGQSRREQQTAHRRHHREPPSRRRLAHRGEGREQCAA